MVAAANKLKRGRTTKISHEERRRDNECDKRGREIVGWGGERKKQNKIQPNDKFAH